jgi:hypothetical protein
MKNKLNIKKIAGIIFVLAFIFSAHNSYAAMVSSTFEVPFKFRNSTDQVEKNSYNEIGISYEGGTSELDWNWSRVKIYLKKNFNLVRENDAIIGTTDFNLNLGKSVRVEDTPPEGTFNWASHTRKLGNYLEDIFLWGSKGGERLSITMLMGNPQETRSNLKLVSQNPNIVSCQNKECTALKAGTAKIVVKFEDSTQDAFGPTAYFPSAYAKGNPTESISPFSIGNPFYKTDQGYGRLKAIAAKTGKWDHNDDFQQKTLTYSFPSVTYNVTVLEGENAPQVSSCASPISSSDIRDTSANIRWNYADSDAQTNYQIQLSPNSNFSSITKSIVAPSGQNVSSIRVAQVTGLTPETNYYARVRTYNPENGWSEYSSCGGFKTKATQDTPEETFSCSAGTFQTASEAIYTADSISNATYQWYIGTSPIQGANSNIYKETFNTKGSYTRTVRITYSDDTNQTQSASCTATVTDDGNPPVCPGGNCDGGGGGGDDGNPPVCPGGNCGGGSDPVMEFEFNPNTAPVDGYCKAYIDVTTTNGCTITSRLGTPYFGTFVDTTKTFFVDGDKYLVGTYTLSCRGTNGVSKTMTRSCYSNPDIRER